MLLDTPLVSVNTVLYKIKQPRVDPLWIIDFIYVAGSLNTIATKIQDSVVVGKDGTGRPVTFRHPAVQTALMFLGESLCLLPYFFYESMRPLTNVDGDSSTAEISKWNMFRKTALSFVFPALCDAGATTLLNLGLYYTYASVFQMLRGTLVCFAGGLTIVVLRRKLHNHNWLGIVLITAGAALVGASSILYKKETDVKSAPNPLLGDILVICAQLLNALQFILEEKYLRKLHPPVLLAVGAEGVVGALLCAVVLPIFVLLNGSIGLPIDDIVAGFKEIVNDWTLRWTTVFTVLSIAAFNFSGVSVTKRLSGAARAAIDACRTAIIWLFCVMVGWEEFHSLQVVGFAILITGTSVYNDILRSCLPAPISAGERAMQHSGIDRARDRHGDGQVSEPLLPNVEIDEEEGIQQGTGRRRMGQVGRFGHSKPITAGHAPNDHTMARTVTILPSALSPHSLASIPSELDLQSVNSSRPMLVLQSEISNGSDNEVVSDEDPFDQPTSTHHNMPRG